MVLKLFNLQNLAQISVAVNLCICHLVAGCMNPVFRSGSSNNFLKVTQIIFSAKMYSFLRAHRYPTYMALLHGITLPSVCKQWRCNLQALSMYAAPKIPDILNNRNDGDWERCKSDRYSNSKSDSVSVSVSGSAESNNRDKDGGTMGNNGWHEYFHRYSTAFIKFSYCSTSWIALNNHISIQDIFTCILLTHC